MTVAQTRFDWMLRRNSSGNVLHRRSIGLSSIHFQISDVFPFDIAATSTLTLLIEKIMLSFESVDSLPTTCSHFTISSSLPFPRWRKVQCCSGRLLNCKCLETLKPYSSSLPQSTEIMPMESAIRNLRSRYPAIRTVLFITKPWA